VGRKQHYENRVSMLLGLMKTLLFAGKNAHSAVASAVRRYRFLLGREVQLARDLYGGLDGHRHRTAILVHSEHALYALAILLFRPEM
jgi:hypothetical protein